jgi:hypothetical protein
VGDTVGAGFEHLRGLEGLLVATACNDFAGNNQNVSYRVTKIAMEHQEAAVSR